MATSNPTGNLYVVAALVPLVEKLRARYPGVRVVSAKFATAGDGVAQQCIRFSAPLERLKECGLVTDRMADNVTDSRRGARNTPIGDGYSLFDGPLDSLVEPGHWDLGIFTGAVPRERERFSVAEAERLLKRFTVAGRCRGQRGPA